MTNLERLMGQASKFDLKNIDETVCYARSAVRCHDLFAKHGPALVEALEQSNKILAVLQNEECDHDVDICFCGEWRQWKTNTQLLATIEKEAGDDTTKVSR